MAGTYKRARAPRVAIAALVAAVALSLGWMAGGGSGQVVSEQPNVIVVMTDDQGPRMMKALPSVKRLIARKGATFEQAIATYPLCCPSRASFLTGQYAHNHGTLGNSSSSGGGYPALLHPQRNLAAWLQGAGYETAFVGKWLNGLRTPRAAPPGWTRWHGLVGAGGEGLSSFYDYSVFAGNGKAREYGRRASDYQTDALTRDYALPLITEQAKTPGPFFLWLAYHPPHDGLGRDDAAGRRCALGEPAERGGRQSAIPPPRYADRFANAPIPRPPSFDERDISDKPGFLRRRDPLGDNDLEIIRMNYRCGLAALLAVDDAVKAMVDALRATGQLDETLIVFTADQGAFAGEHRIKAGKNRPYEEALRVPLYMRGPGIAPASQLRGAVGNIDVAPTILELAGVTPQPELERAPDGVSLAPDLARGATSGDRALLIEGRSNVSRARRAFKVRSYVGVRTNRFVYVEHRRTQAATAQEGAAMPIGVGRTTDRELYDLTRDPFQLRSRQADRAYAPTRQTLATLLGRLEGCAGASCAVEASVPVPR